MRTFLFVTVAGFSRRFRQDFTVTDEHNMFAAELLFQFAYEAHLHLLESLQLGHGYIDDD